MQYHHLRSRRVLGLGSLERSVCRLEERRPGKTQPKESKSQGELEWRRVGPKSDLGQLSGGRGELAGPARLGTSKPWESMNAAPVVPKHADRVKRSPWRARNEEPEKVGEAAGWTEEQPRAHQRGE